MDNGLGSRGRQATAILGRHACRPRSGPRISAMWGFPAPDGLIGHGSPTVPTPCDSSSSPSGPGGLSTRAARGHDGQLGTLQSSLIEVGTLRLYHTPALGCSPRAEAVATRSSDTVRSLLMSSTSAELYQHDVFQARRQLFKLLGAAFHLRTMDGRLLAYSKQKAFKLREDIRVFADEAQTVELLNDPGRLDHRLQRRLQGHRLAVGRARRVAPPQGMVVDLPGFVGAARPRGGRPRPGDRGERLEGLRAPDDRPGELRPAADPT